MGTDAHGKVAIAQTVAYTPIVPLVIYILIRNWRYRPRMAWYPFVLFSIMRLAGGPVVLALQSNDTSAGLVIAALILLNVGLIPLLVATLGLIRLILTDNPEVKLNPDTVTKMARIAFFAAASLISAGAGLVERPEGRILTVAGYSVFAAILVVMIFIQLFLWQKLLTLTPHTKKVLRHTILAIPFLIVRTVYAFADIDTASDVTSRWSPLYGSATLFVIMCLLMEYIVLCLYMWIGLTIPRKLKKMGSTKRHRLRVRTGETPHTTLTPENRLS